MSVFSLETKYHGDYTCVDVFFPVWLQVSEEGSPMWEPSPQPYSVEVRDPEKRSKFKGIKSFIAYHIIPSVSE